MTSIQKKIQFSEKTDKEIYNAAILAVPQAGLKVWKTRELAHLVLAQGEFKGEQVRCNIVVSMVDGSTTITAESDNLDEKKLKNLTGTLQNKSFISFIKRYLLFTLAIL
ncbi:MAG: hypothetical protein J7K66_05145 [Anaerolineaceae bacterium]|nr:hypothetical protein [Anaerolineaceae bacterium]